MCCPWQVPAAGAKPSPDAQLPPHIGVLITGCQAAETSADACPSGDPSRAFGALTNALTTTVKEFKAAYPDQNISYRSVPSCCLKWLSEQCAWVLAVVVSSTRPCSAAGRHATKSSTWSLSAGKASAGASHASNEHPSMALAADALFSCLHQISCVALAIGGRCCC